MDADGTFQKSSVEPLNQWSKTTDFPVINPDFSGNKNKYVYAASSSGSRQTLPHFPFDTVVKLDLLDKSIHTWTVGARRFIGEPILVSKGGEEDDGYLLVVEVGNQSALKRLFPMFFCSITGKKLVKYTIFAHVLMQLCCLFFLFCSMQLRYKGAIL